MDPNDPKFRISKKHVSCELWLAFSSGTKLDVFFRHDIYFIMPGKDLLHFCDITRHETVERLWLNRCCDLFIIDNKMATPILKHTPSMVFCVCP